MVLVLIFFKTNFPPFWEPFPESDRQAFEGTRASSGPKSRAGKDVGR